MDAQYVVGGCSLQKKSLFPKNLPQAIYYLELAANQGHAYAQYILGLNYANGFGVLRDFKRAIQYFDLASQQNVAAALYKLCMFYETGLGVDRNPLQAARYFQLLSDFLHGKENECFYFLGLCFLKGMGVKKDLCNAAANFLIADKLKKDRNAQFFLGYCFENMGDLKRAAHFYKLAANQGLSESI